MTDLPALKSRLSDPREVARLLGLRVMSRCSGGVYVQCPIHGGKGDSLGLRNKGGTLQAKCFVCNFGPKGEGGDVFTLLTAIEGSFERGLARAVEMAGGAIGAPVEQHREPERLEPALYDTLAQKILDAGRLDGRSWTRDVGQYLQRRGLLEFAQGDGWAAMPSLGWLLELAKEVCDGVSADNNFTLPNEPTPDDRVFAEARALCADGRPTVGVSRIRAAREHACNTAFAERKNGARDLLVSARLAKLDNRGQFVPAWPGHRLAIPWRGPDGRITALQRRRVTDGNGPKYVLPWAPEWPYGSERVGGYGASDIQSASSNVGDARSVRVASACGGIKTRGPVGHRVDADMVRMVSRPSTAQYIAIVEGAVDTLAMRALHPSFVVLGIPGIGGWRALWASLVQERGLRVALDRGKPVTDGIIPEDRAAARIALDCAGRGQETDRVIEWWVSRHRRGRALGCVLCGRQEPYEWATWLCGGCGRRRAPKGSDWGGLWEARSAR